MWYKHIFGISIPACVAVLKEAEQYRRVFFISSCSAVWPHKHLLISISGNLSLAWCSVVLPLCFPLAGKLHLHNNQKYHQKLPSTIHVQKNWFAVVSLGIAATVAKIWPQIPLTHCIDGNSMPFTNSAFWSNFQAIFSFFLQPRYFQETWVQAMQA